MSNRDETKFFSRLREPFELSEWDKSVLNQFTDEMRYSTGVTVTCDIFKENLL